MITLVAMERKQISVSLPLVSFRLQVGILLACWIARAVFVYAGEFAVAYDAGLGVVAA